MIILLYDVCYLEIYCKKQIWLKQFMYAAINLPEARVEKKFTNTDERTTMYVW